MSKRMTRVRGGVLVSLCTVSVFLLAGSGFVRSEGRPPDQNAGARNAAISGTITNGVTGAGLPGVVVILTNVAAAGSVQTLSDSQGRFVFTDLPASTYALQVVKARYTASGLARQGLFPPTFSVADGEWIDHANVVMWPLGGITGAVVDERGEPVVGVPVRVFTRVAVAGSHQWAAGPIGYTDDRGSYRIPGLKGGDYVVAVPSVQATVPATTAPTALAGFSEAFAQANRLAIPEIAGLRRGESWRVIGQYAVPPGESSEQVYPLLFHPAARTLDQAAVVALADGEERRNIDVVLAPVTAATVSGRIVGPPDAISGLVVRLLPSGGHALGAGSEQATALVEPDGRFTMLGVPAGRYQLLAGTGYGEYNVEPTYHLPATAGHVASQYMQYLPTAAGDTILRTRYLPDRRGHFARLDLTIGANDIHDVVVTLVPGAVIRGRVVREDGGALPRRVSVTAEPASGDPTLATAPPDQSPSTRSTGEFEIPGLDRGEYLLRVSAGAWIVKSIVADRDYTDRPFSVEPGVDLSGVTVTLTDKAATVSGVVRAASGEIAAEAAVMVFPNAPEWWTGYGIQPPRLKSVLAFGRNGYRLSGLPAGEYLLIAVPPGLRDRWQDPRFLQGARAVASRMTLGWGSVVAKDLSITSVTVR